MKINKANHTRSNEYKERKKFIQNFYCQYYSFKKYIHELKIKKIRCIIKCSQENFPWHVGKEGTQFSNTLLVHLSFKKIPLLSSLFHRPSKTFLSSPLQKSPHTMWFMFFDYQELDPSSFSFLILSPKFIFSAFLKSQMWYPTLYSTASWRVSKTSILYIQRDSLLHTYTCTPSTGFNISVNYNPILPIVQTKDIWYIHNSSLSFIPKTIYKDNISVLPLKYIKNLTISLLSCLFKSHYKLLFLFYLINTIK